MNKAPFDFKQKTVLVVGGTSGIGKALALGFARAGADVIASSRSADACAEMAAQIRSLGGRSVEAASDVADRASIEALRRIVLESFAQVDVLINCAGITKKQPTLEATDEEWDRIFDINLTGTLRACQIFGADMLQRRSGRIINIASLSTFVAFHQVAAYGASKAAIGALTRSLAVEWAPHNVAVNAIAPGIFPTALNSAILASPRGKELEQRTPAARFGQPEELLTAALYLASEASSFTTGQILTVDGGFMASGVNR